MTAGARIRPAPGPRYDLRIGELVIEGLPRIDGQTFLAALEHELAQLLTGPDAPFTPAAAKPSARLTFEALAGETIAAGPGTSSQTIGVAAAQAVFRQLKVLSAGGGDRSAGRGGGR